MAGELIKTLRVRLEADAAELVKGLDAAADKVANVGQSMVGMGRKLTAAVTLPIAAIGAASFKMAVDAEESANKFNVVMGDAAESVRARLEDLTNTIPLTRQEMEAMAAGVQDMLVPMGVVREQAAGMSVDMVALAGDLASFNNVGTDEVLMAIQSALAGSSEPMRRFGVDTRVTRLEALALEKGLIDQGEALDNTTTAMAVLMAIQEDSTDAMGDAARTVDSTANQMRFLWREVKELGITIGDILIPVVTPLIAHLKSLVAWFGDLSPTTQKVIVVAAGLAAALGPLLVVFGTILTLLPQIVAGIKLVGLAIGSPFTAPIALAVVAIGSIVAAGIQVIEHWDVLKYEAGRLVEHVTGFFRDMGRDIRNIVSEMVDRVKEFFVGGFTRVVDSIKGQLDRVTGFFSSMADKLVGHSIVIDMVNGVVDEFGRMANGMVASTGEGTMGVRGLFSNLSGDLGGEAGATADSVLGHFGRMNDGMFSNTQDSLGRVGALFSDFGIELPSRVKSVVDEIASRWGNIKDVMELPAKETLSKSLSDWKAWALDIVDIIKSVWNKVKGWVGGISNALNAGTTGPGAGIPGTGGTGIIVVPGGGNLPGTDSFEWAWVQTAWINTNKFLEEIRNNTAAMAGMSIDVNVNVNGGAGGTEENTTTGQEIGDSILRAINDGLGSMVLRDNRLAGYVEVV